MTPRRRHHDLEPNLTFDEGSGRYRFRNPVTGKRTWFGRDKATANEKARKANLALRIMREQQRAGADPVTVSGVVDGFLASRAPQMPWSDGTRRNYEFKLEAIRREFGKRLFVGLDRVVIADWLAERCANADAWNKWRHTFILLYRYAIGRKLTNYNEAEAVEKLSGSTILPANQKRRAPLTEDAFWWVFDRAEAWLRTAMKLSLVTLQGRAEIVAMQYGDVRDGELYVIRQKTSRKSECAFIRIAVAGELEQIIAASRGDGVASQYVVHRRPARQRAGASALAPDWAAVRPAYLSRAFAALARAAVEERAIVLEPGDTPPSFHELRGLGSRLYLAAGFSKEYVQMLMTHSDPKITAIYTEGGRDALKDSDFKPVAAGLRMAR